MLVNTAGSMTRLVCNWLLSVVAVRLSSDFDAAGVLSLSMSVCNVVQPFAECRLRTIHVTDTQGERNAGEYLGLRILSTGASLALGMIYALATCSAEALPVIAAYVSSQLVATYLEGLHAVDQREYRMDYIGVSYALQGVCGIALFSISLSLSNSLFLATCSLLAVNALIGLLWDAPRTRQFGSIKPVIDVRGGLRVLLSLLPIVLSSVCASAVITFPRQYLASVSGTSALGIYSSVAAPTVVIQVGAQYVYTPLLGRFAELMKDSPKNGVYLFLKTSLCILLVGTCCMILFASFGEWMLLIIFGPGVAEHSNLLLPSVACTFITGFSLFLNDLLISLRDFQSALLGNVFGSIVSLVTAVPLVSAYGMNGVSLCGLVGYGLSGFLMLLSFGKDTSVLLSSRD